MFNRSLAALHLFDSNWFVGSFVVISRSANRSNHYRSPILGPCTSTLPPATHALGPRPSNTLRSRCTALIFLREPNIVNVPVHPICLDTCSLPRCKPRFPSVMFATITIPPPPKWHFLANLKPTDGVILVLKPSRRVPLAGGTDYRPNVACFVFNSTRSIVGAPEAQEARRAHLVRLRRTDIWPW